MISRTEGLIGYSDVASIPEARRSNAVTALTIDNKAFDRNTAAEVAYPFWTVEYLYSRRPPAEGGLLASFLAYVQRKRRRTGPAARVRLHPVPDHGGRAARALQLPLSSRRGRRPVTGDDLRGGCCVVRVGAGEIVKSRLVRSGTSDP